MPCLYRRKLDQLNFAANLKDLRSPPKNNLEALKGDLILSIVLLLLPPTSYLLPITYELITCMV
ncbi:MAG: hypothetical protein AAF652_17320 [Cyanobacteria bacterium P01_C01_bin.72]